MDDLTMTRLCAEAMELDHIKGPYDGMSYIVFTEKSGKVSSYDPLHGDAQALQLVKKFEIELQPPVRDKHAQFEDGEINGWTAFFNCGGVHAQWVCALDINRAIVECVALMQCAKSNA